MSPEEMEARGMVNLGDVTKLAENNPGLLNSSGEPIHDDKPDAHKYAEGMLEQSLMWLEVDDAIVPMWQPRLNVPGICQRYGPPRPAMEFMSGERNMMVQLLANDVAEYVFGVPPFLEQIADDGHTLDMPPNPEWSSLPVQNDWPNFPPKNNE